MSIATQIYSQFSRPRGILGRVAGYIMAHRRSNIERSDWALSLLAITPADRILEIGFGPGFAAGKAAAAAAEVVGVDHSTLMVSQATGRNRALVASGKLKLMAGSVETVGADLGLFDKIYSVNVVHFWKAPVSNFKRLRSLLKPGGLILTVYMPRHAGATDADALAKGRQIEDWLREAGYSHIRTESKMMKPVAAIAVSATLKP